MRALPLRLAGDARVGAGDAAQQAVGGHLRGRIGGRRARRVPLAYADGRDRIEVPDWRGRLVKLTL